ncbi:helix-turn-helix transcriptional regulator [Vagococcus sp. BWB3-3]|uniref:Helix-turn-helix transcriptional regulator n=1 Tax=Vagococcus allomyrinae TaxID=2794353 RepID=A0A940PD78_9ENTE|nr:helix-turn-helix transcriptional regulator [Vagococcus allomyrinae]MBP1042422.1 helix-turn-helix transcriptional regulator [Vagococcus allomyrinae]
MKLNELLKIRREKENMTQAELAQKLFVTHQSVSKWERGENVPSVDNLLQLSDLYNISLDELIRGSSFFKKPFFVRQPINKLKIIAFLVFWLFLSLFFTGFGYQPFFVFILIYCIGLFMVFPTFFQDYWIINRSNLVIKKYSSNYSKVFELFKTSLNQKNEQTIEYTQIVSVSLEYYVRVRTSPFDFHPDPFFLEVTLANDDCLRLPLTSKIEEYLPQFFMLLQKKGITMIDDHNIMPVMIRNESVFEYMNQTITELKGL